MHTRSTSFPEPSRRRSARDAWPHRQSAGPETGRRSDATIVTERTERLYITRYHARWVGTVSAPPMRDATVVVDRDRIAYVGPRARAPAGRDEELGDVALVPGLVNAHTHLELTAMRGVLDGLPFFTWVRTLTAARQAVLRAEDLLDS